MIYLKNLKFTIISLFYYFFLYSNIFAFSGEEIIEKFKDKFLAIDTMKGQLNITYQSGEIYSGTFMYMNPGKIYIKFTDPPGKNIITDGKILWIYDSSTDVCGVQDLDTEDKETKPDEDVNADTKKTGKVRLGGGADTLLKSYQLISVSNDSSSYTLELQNNNRKYSDIKLILNPDFMLVKAIFKDKNGDGYSVKIFDIKTGERLIPGIFNFNVPANAQVVKNPLDIR